MKKTLKQIKALSDETRLRIVNLLYYNELYVCEIVEVLKLPQSTVSRHLVILKNANVILDEKQGSWIKYSLAQNILLNDIIRILIENSLKNDEKSSLDLKNLNERMKCIRGCRDNERNVK